MSSKKLYSVLGVSETASPDEIKSAYRKAAAKWHPDKCKDPAKIEEFNAKFKEIGQANEILSDQSKRQIYDQVGDNSKNNIDDVIRQQEEMKNMRGFPFGNMFGQGQGQGQGMQVQFNPNIIFNVKLTIEEIFTGKEIVHQITRQIINIVGGKITQSMETESITVKIPRGVRSGETIVVSKNGNKLIQEGTIRNQGSINCIVEEKPHSTFERSQAQPLHLLVKHTITIFQALLGNFDITLNGPDKNKFDVSIGQTIINPNTAICVIDKGMISATGKKGNIYITFNIEYPTQLSSEQRTILENMTNYVKSVKKSNIATSQLTIEALQRLINTPDPTHSENAHADPFSHMFNFGQGQGRGATNVHVQQCQQQ